VSPAQGDEWLAALEQATGARVNVIVDACHAGSFIDLPQKVSRAGRVVIASTGSQNVAYASPAGAIFSDYFLAALGQGQSLYNGFQSARAAVQIAYPDQTPWLDDDGNGIANETTDGQEAQRRGFTYAGTFDSRWPPYVAQVSGPAVAPNGQGTIRAQILDDPDSWIRRVWLVVYPPSYQPPSPGERLVNQTLPGAVLQDQGGGWYAVTYTGFTERGVYRVVLFAEDSDGLEARGVALTVHVGPAGFLPLVMRGNYSGSDKDP
jgi:hypothetical protein